MTVSVHIRFNVLRTYILSFDIIFSELSKTSLNKPKTWLRPVKKDAAMAYFEVLLPKFPRKLRKPWNNNNNNNNNNKTWIGLQNPMSDLSSKRQYSVNGVNHHSASLGSEYRHHLRPFRWVLHSVFFFIYFFYLDIIDLYLRTGRWGEVSGNWWNSCLTRKFIICALYQIFLRYCIIASCLSGGGFEYLHSTTASRKRQWKGNPVPGDITGRVSNLRQ
jgi:hypothetical protein